MKPFFKWSGGKRKETPVVDEFKPKQFNTYYEPFVGGGAVWLHLEHPKSVINDSYKEMINFYRVLASDTQRLVDTINGLSKNYSIEVSGIVKDELLEKKVTQLKLEVDLLKGDENEVDKFVATKAQLRAAKKELNKDFYTLADKYYYYYRDNQFENKFDEAVKFYMLRQLSFSGMLRFGKEGNFNIPYGWYKSFKGITENVEDIQKVLGNTSILCGDWKDAVKEATKNDFVFLDPPYTRRFSEYHHAGQFGESEHKELADWFSTTPARAMIIINKDEYTEKLYKKYIKQEYDKRYSIQYRDRMQEKDSNAIHIVATNYSP